ncbi:unnamed protein product [Paramecium octaurelia]|uniref:Uncharacterized protein n=1 Tax=Paramecium octaurelia TaxID=43137 RepID=A0A8S1TKC2_PAROT|nr:unnamed protein product [Paramecium octaurelia]
MYNHDEFRKVKYDFLITLLPGIKSMRSTYHEILNAHNNIFGDLGNNQLQIQFTKNVHDFEPFQDADSYDIDNLFINVSMNVYEKIMYDYKLIVIVFIFCEQEKFDWNKLHELVEVIKNRSFKKFILIGIKDIGEPYQNLLNYEVFNKNIFYEISIKRDHNNYDYVSDQLKNIFWEIRDNLMDPKDMRINLQQEYQEKVMKIKVFDDFQNINVIQLGEECIKMFQLQAEQKNINLTLKTNIKPLYIYTDKNRLKWIIIHLLANAMKFTIEGSISIKITQRGFLVDVGVEDTGIGMSQQDQNSFNQKLDIKRVGLGLVISDKIAQQLSSDGQGLKVIARDTKQSYFYLILKIKQFHAKINSSKLQQVEITENESPLFDKHIQLSQFRMTFNHDQNSFADDQKLIDKINCQHILIVDANVFNQNSLERQIQQFTKTQIDKNNSGIEAIESVKSKKCNQNCQGYNTVFMDMEMPGLDGLQASAQILQFNAKIKIFIVSGYEKSQFDEESKKIGIQEFLVKPISKDVIQRVILENNL